ncbi:MAG TPA: hypothetical protein VGG48_14025 [Rhizomicrobium sp.]|jgi:hypothetical protein
MTARARAFWMLMAGMCLAPLFWLGQLILGYWISALACYGNDHPTAVASADALRGAFGAFDAIAIAAGLIGFAISWSSFRATQEGERARFMAVWGLLSSVCFLIGIVFETIASLTVPLCAG